LSVGTVAWRAAPGAHDGPARVLILGGTGEARRLADVLLSRGVEVVSSLAGRTSEPALPEGEVRRGGFGGADGLAAYIAEQRPWAVIDATHPYAQLISRNARRACAALRVPRLRLERPSWQPMPGDDWRQVEDLEQAVSLAAEIGRRVFLSTGSAPLELLQAYPDHWFLLRSVEPIAGELPNLRHITARGPFHCKDEIDLLDGHRIEVVVSKASGGSSVYAKIEAARELGLPVVMLRRPDPPPGPLVERIADAVAWLDQVTVDRRAGRSTWV
jgi:precorrin-6A/cobalt-precorrin-6A reductase